MKFDWDPKKAKLICENTASRSMKRQLHFSTARRLRPVSRHSIGEERYITFGYSQLTRLLAVCHTYRPGAIRIINARRVTRSERKIYEEG